MPAGLLVFGDDGQVQIDGSTPHVTLLRKGVTQSGNNPPGANGNYALAVITVNPGEILAFRPQAGQWAAVWGRQDSLVTLNCTGTGTQIEYWIFSKHQPSGLNYGMQVFDETGTMIYDTGRPVMNVLGSHDGTGGPSYWSTGGCAVIPWQQFASTRRYIEIVGVGPSPDFMAFIEATMGTVSISGNAVSTMNQEMFLNGFGPYKQQSNFPDNWPYEGNNGLDNRYLVISTDNL